MTCSLMRGRVGYNGQRYEVHFLDENEKDHILGWIEAADGGALVKSIELHPIWHSPRVVDLKAEKS
jgi:hypothetical protein